MPPPALRWALDEKLAARRPKCLQIDPTAESVDDVGDAGASERQRAPLERAYRASLLRVYPQRRPNFAFVPEVVQLCLPRGLRFFTERRVPERRFHSFVLVREDGARVNGCALTFYEPVADAALRQRMLDLHHDYIRDVTEPAVTGDRAPPPGQPSGGQHTLPRNFSRRSAAAVKRVSYYDSASKPIYVAKCLCVLQRSATRSSALVRVVCRLPILFSVENILLSLWRAGVERDAAAPLDPRALIYWALHEVPLPLPGTALHVSYGDCDLSVRRPGLCELPFFDYPIFELFTLLPVDKLVKLFTCFMLEHQLLLCSKSARRSPHSRGDARACRTRSAHAYGRVARDAYFSVPMAAYIRRLNDAGSCARRLIQARLQVPVLPYAQLKFIEAPVPYLMGFLYENRMPDQIFHVRWALLPLFYGFTIAEQRLCARHRRSSPRRA